MKSSSFLKKTGRNKRSDIEQISETLTGLSDPIPPCKGFRGDNPEQYQIETPCKGFSENQRIPPCKGFAKTLTPEKRKTLQGLTPLKTLEGGRPRNNYAPTTAILLAWHKAELIAFFTLLGGDTEKKCFIIARQFAEFAAKKGEHDFGLAVNNIARELGSFPR